MRTVNAILILFRTAVFPSSVGEGLDTPRETKKWLLLIVPSKANDVYGSHNIQNDIMIHEGKMNFFVPLGVDSGTSAKPCRRK